MSAPRQYPGVMVSSTFADLADHRAALMKALHGQQLHAVAMEDDAARLVDVLESSLEKVRSAAGYIAIISRRYGQVPEHPSGLSLTHLEFREAVKLGLPILIFIMGPRHPLTEADVELDPVKRDKLEAFREEAKLAGGAVHRVYKEFNDLGDFATAATRSVAELHTLLAASAPPPPAENDGHIPAPPALYAQARYLGSHDFVGREAQLATLSDWARPAEQHPVLLFEAIGGTGKSMLTWEWTTNHANGDWAGRFWYSFYEAGAVMADFCQRALAYMTGRPLASFKEKKQHELSELLSQQLGSKPWLLVLDGLERVLVAYHRDDAAQLLDEDAGGPDSIGSRHPCAAIRPEDEDLLRRLAVSAPSKILITSRLVPRVLLNPASQPIPGVLHERLPGLRPADAEGLLRSCGVTGDSKAMREYLQKHCDCHPLVTGILAGLISGYLPARGDFDAWAADRDHGGRLDVGELNLVQKRNHILHAALASLPKPSRALLSTLALLSDSVDYETLSAVSPCASPHELTCGVTDLERSGLLQYDRQTRHYDLHPVVRAVAAGELAADDRERLGQRVIDHFSAAVHRRYENVSDINDVRPHLTVVRTLLQMGMGERAFFEYGGELAQALLFKLEAAPEALALLRGFFTDGWNNPIAGLPSEDVAYLWNDVGLHLPGPDNMPLSLSLFEKALQTNLQNGLIGAALVNLRNIATGLRSQNRLARSLAVGELGATLTVGGDDLAGPFFADIGAIRLYAELGWKSEVERIWRTIDRTREWDYLNNHAGLAELDYAVCRFLCGDVVDEDFSEAEQLARRYRNRGVLRRLHHVRGDWLTECGRWAEAEADLAVAVRMARESGAADEGTEVLLAYARHELGRLPDARAQAERLTATHGWAELALARLWRSIGDAGRAAQCALSAHRFACADGEPYVIRPLLERVERLLVDLGVQVPEVPAYDPAADPEFPWESEVRATVERLRQRNGMS